MKTLFLIASLFALVSISEAQTNSMPAFPSQPPVSDFLGLSGAALSVEQGLEHSGLLASTNYAVAPYFTYAPRAKDRIGGGLLIPFNFPALSGDAGSVGAAFGVDYLGHWSLISGNVQLKVETHPFNIPLLSFLPQAVRNLGAEPVAIVGVGVQTSGSGATTLWDVGYDFHLGQLVNGIKGSDTAWLDNLDGGFVWGEWMNAGDESGHRWHFFLAYRVNF